MDPPDIDAFIAGIHAKAEADATINREFIKFANQPAVRQDNAILRVLENIQQDMRNMQEDIRNIQQTLGRMETMQGTEHFNTVARSRNARMVDGTTELAVLLDTRTGQPIADFPRTCSQLRRLSMPNVDQILRALGVYVEGESNAVRKGRLLDEIGLPRVPT